MAGYRKSLPPLDTLVFFESVARRGGFTRAAEELYVSQAAVSKRIRQLEDWLGAALFERTGRGLRPTEAGRRLAERVSVTLDFLEHGLNAARAPERPAVRIAANSAVAMFWLQPRLKAFALGEAACAVNLTTTDHPGDLMSGAHDLALVYGGGAMPGRAAVRVLDEELAPVAAPDVAARLARDGGTAPLLDYDRLAPDWIDWEIWARRAGREEMLAWPRTACSSYIQSIGRALAGAGVALGSLPLLQREIGDGALVRVGAGGLVTGKGYYLTHDESRVLGEDARRLLAFLAGGDAGGQGGRMDSPPPGA